MAIARTHLGFMDEAMNRLFGILVLAAATLGIGCAPTPPPYGTEATLSLPGSMRQVWAVAPTINLSGVREVDPLLQSDILYGQLQTVGGVTAIPVNRVIEVYSSLRLDKVQSEEQAAVVCDLLGCDGLLVPTVTAYDPYNPPKFGGSLQLFTKPGAYQRSRQIDPRELSRQASPGEQESLSQSPNFVQSVGMFDAADGSVRDDVKFYALGRQDPSGPLGEKEYLVSMDRYCQFAYFKLLRGLVEQMEEKQ